MNTKGLSEGMLAVIFTLYAPTYMNIGSQREGRLKRTQYYCVILCVILAHQFSLWRLHVQESEGCKLLSNLPCAANNGGVYTVENMSCWRYK